MTLRAHRLIKANRLSPIEHYSHDGRTVFFRLANGERFELAPHEVRDVGALRWRHFEDRAA